MSSGKVKSGNKVFYSDESDEYYSKKKSKKSSKSSKTSKVKNDEYKEYRREDSSRKEYSDDTEKQYRREDTSRREYSDDTEKQYRREDTSRREYSENTEKPSHRRKKKDQSKKREESSRDSRLDDSNRTEESNNRSRTSERERTSDQSRRKHRDEEHEEYLYNESYSQKRSYGYESKRYESRLEKSPDTSRKKSEEISKAHSPPIEKVDDTEPLSKRQKIIHINMRTGGAYIPPARLRMMQESIQDKGSENYQRIAWEALKKSIVGMTNKVNASNIADIVRELFKENLIRGRGVLSRAIMQAQSASPTFTRVYAALVAIINTKFPEIGELILHRLILQYRRGFRRNDKVICMNVARFVAHLLNQEVAHEVLILEMVTHLLENPTDDSVEIAIATLKECGKKLSQLTSVGMRAITQRIRDVLHEKMVDLRVHYMIEVFFAVQKDGFKDFETISEGLDLVEEDDKYTHLINLDEAMETQDVLNVFKFDAEYVENEEKYKTVVKEILGDSSDEEESGDESDGEEGGDEDEAKGDGNQEIIDMTETNIVCLRRKIYLTIQSSLDFEECAHKLLRLELKPGQILEMCYMILDCCAQQRTYEKFFGLLAQRFCQLNKIYVEPFTEIFENSYKTIHRLETNKLRNVAKFFAHLLYTDAISWMVLSIIKLNEEDTTSSSRIFIKILFQELCEYMGLSKLNERVKDITLQGAFEGLFPRDHPHNTRFAVNFFTSIGLGGLTDELREHLKNLPKNPVPIAASVLTPAESSSSPDSSSSSSSSSSSTSSSSSSSSDSDSDSRGKEDKCRKKK